MLQKELLTVFSDGEQTRDFVNVNDVAVQVNINPVNRIGSAKRTAQIINEM